MKAFITAEFDEYGLKLLTKHMEYVYESWRTTKKIFFDENEFIKKIKSVGADVLIVEPDFVLKNVIEQCNPKIIASCRDDPWNVDIKTATEKGIPVFSAPHRNTQSVAELTLGLILSVARNITKADRYLRAGKIIYKSETDFLEYHNMFEGIELGGKKVGIIGLGAIGFEVAKRLRNGFGSEILVYDPYVDKNRLKEVNGKSVDLETLMRESDIVTVHTKVTNETKGLITRKHFEMMKKTAYFINTARAAITEEDALFETLRDKKIAGAGLDVFIKDPIESGDRFLTLDNIVATPHIGGNTTDTVTRQSKMIAEGIDSYLTGKEPKYVLNKEVLKKPKPKKGAK
ncbi:MAG: NAD(P)-dependent oxidoreductase [Candidatus Freyarchaeum deiterrae]